MHIQDHQGTRPGAVSGDRILEFPVGGVLQPQIDTERKVLPHARGRFEFQVANDVAEPVLQYQLAAVLAAQQGVERQFDAFEADVVDIGDADDVCRGFSRRVVAPVFLLEIQALDAKLADPLRLGPGHTPLEVDKGLVVIRLQERIEPFGIRPQVGRQALQVRLCQAMPGGIRPDGGYGRADGQGLTEPVVDDASIGRNNFGTQRARVALFLKKVFLQIGKPCDPGGNGNGSREQERQQEVVPPGFQGNMRSTSLGNCMFNSAPATFSTWW